MIPTHATPFVASTSVLPDKDGVEQLILILKATYDIGEEGSLTPAVEQDPIVSCDELRGDPAHASIVREGELMPPKPLGTDVFLIGHAVAPRSGTTQMMVSLRVGQLEKSALVFGPRVWHSGALSRAQCTDPEPFERVELCYENAFGGEDRTPGEQKDWEDERRNPIGRGFLARASKARWEGTLLPQIEDPRSLITGPADRPVPLSFGPIGRHWEPRIRYAGTYDQAWLDERAPLLPDDFDDRFHHAVPDDQVLLGHLQGGEPVEVAGCTAGGPLRFTMPRLRPRAYVDMRLESQRREAMRCDAVIVDADRHKLLLVYKVMMKLPVSLLDVGEIAIDLGEEASA